MKKVLLTITGLVLTIYVFSQSYDSGLSVIKADPRIDSLVALHIAYNELHPVVDGYRIHIFIKSGNDALLEAEEVKLEFEEKHDNVKAYITFGEPYYRVRVGDFRTRLEAEKFLHKINRTYPNAWVTKDKINLPELKKYPKTDEYE